MRTAIGTSIFLLVAASIGAGADNSPDTIAKYLAGLAVPANATPMPASTPAPRSVPRAVPATPSAVPTSRPRAGSLIPDRVAQPSQPRGESRGDLSQVDELGHPAPGSASIEPGSAWATHSEELDRAWSERTNAQLAAVAGWAPENVRPAYRFTGTMFYMFSGPDFMYAHAFFPSARTYILVGNEPVGPLPDLNRIAPNELPFALANIRKSLASVLSWSFFITKDMKTDLTNPQLSGTLPLLYLFLARANCTIDSVTPVAVTNDGNIVERQSEKEEGKMTPGVRIVFQSPAAAGSDRRTLYYFCTDLSDDGIKSTPGLMKFCESQGRGVSLLKAASYLMHEPGFSKVRQFLLDRSSTIVQDDSGIPFRFFAENANEWNLQLWGPYAGPIDIFKQYYQPDLANAFATTPGLPVPFGFGYQWQANRSNLLIATHR